MATYKIVYWRDIPSLVPATEGSEKVNLELSERFQLLIRFSEFQQSGLGGS